MRGASDLLSHFTEPLRLSLRPSWPNIMAPLRSGHAPRSAPLPAGASKRDHADQDQDREDERDVEREHLDDKYRPGNAIWKRLISRCAVHQTRAASSSGARR